MLSQRILEQTAKCPDNGKSGWWIVDGLRHSAYVKASNAEEAITKAHTAEVVDASWEYPTAKFWTAELPEAFSAG